MKIKSERLLESLTEWVMAEQPWPYHDVDRDSDEAKQQARVIAKELLPIVERMWDPSK